jgi:putative oxidoreductase
MNMNPDRPFAAPTLVDWLLRAPGDAPRATILIRFMAGSVFFWEGLLKLVYANQGVGRFTKLGFPLPGATATFVAALEIVGGALLVTGLWTRVVALLFSVEMLVAMLSTKITLYLGTSPLAPPAVPPKSGGWAVLHEIRSEWAQLFCCVFLLLVGAGAISLDARRRDRARA